MKEPSRTALILERQWLHALALVALLVGAWIVARGWPCFHRGEFWVHYVTVERPDMGRICGSD